MTDLVARVQQALQAVPHDENCSWMMGDVTTYGNPACDCDREQRIAQRVTAAIEAAASVVDDYGYRSDERARFLGYVANILRAAYAAERESGKDREK